MKAWGFYRPLAADSHHFKDDPNLSEKPDPHFSDRLDPDPHLSEKLDTYPHLSEGSRSALIVANPKETFLRMLLFLRQGEGERDRQEEGRLRYRGRRGGHSYHPPQGGAQH
jgi:hypothetical protein